MALHGSSGYIRGKRGLQVILQHNKAFAQQLNQALGGLPKRALAAYAATALDAMVDRTFHDSSRAAANWNLSFGMVPTSTQWDPKRYEQPPIGKRGDKGAHKEAVRQYKQLVYGYQSKATHMEPVAGGMLARQVGVKSGPFAPLSEWFRRAPMVYLYNPILTADEANKYYVINAFARNGVPQEFLAGAASGDIGRVLGDFIPNAIHELNYEIRSLAARKLI